MVWSLPTKWNGGVSGSVVLEAAGACGWGAAIAAGGGVDM